MRCHDCRKAVTEDASAIRGRTVPSRRWGAKVGYREFRRVRLCSDCMGRMEWRRVLADREQMRSWGLS